MDEREEDLPLFAPVFHRQTQGFTVAAPCVQSVEEEHPKMATAIQALPRPAKKKAEPEKISDYAPLASVWYGEDAELLERMLDFYPRKKPRKILDATVNGGRFWRNSKRPVTGMDIDPRYNPDILADNTNMPLDDASFDVIIYDPPHIPNQGRDNKKDFNTRFGLVLRSSKENHYTFTHTFPPFLREAYRVLKTEGILLCKITDYVHHHRYQWAHIELINAAREVGFMPCDCIVKIRKGPIIDPKWKKAHHTRRQHCYWLVFRKSKKCE
jgi:SAM-dependent methyltransferase